MHRYLVPTNYYIYIMPAMPHILTNNTHNFDKYINPNQICEISECMPVLDPL